VLGLRENFPHAGIVYFTAPEFVALVRHSGVADAVFPMSEYSTFKFCDDLFDLVLEPTLHNGRTGADGRIHIVDDFCAEVGVTPPDRQPRLTIPRSLLKRVYAQISVNGEANGPLIGIHTGPTWAVKEWADEHWQELVCWLTTTHHARVVQLGMDAHIYDGPRKVKRIEGSADFVGRFSLVQAAAAIQACDLFVGIDSGPLHLAGAVGTPCVGLFGPVDSRFYLPPETPSIGVVADVPCIGCHQRKPIAHWGSNCPEEIACMKLLPVSKVAEACDALLSRHYSKARRPATMARST
jgi:ADP-heptose:LPS heptosyltransferase